MMLMVLIYAYATGVFSSRKIAKNLHEDVAFRYLAAENFPTHRTICDFRLRHPGHAGGELEEDVASRERLRRKWDSLPTRRGRLNASSRRLESGR